MRTTILSFLVVLTASLSSKAQNLIAVQNGNTPQFYQLLDDAVVNAVAGDTIYIPGGIFTLNQPINKRLHIIGVGHNPASTIATNYTKIMNPVFIQTGADYGSLTGLYLNSNITFDTVNHFIVSRCNMGQGYYNESGLSNSLFYENVFRYTINFGVGLNNSYFNNIFNYIFYGFSCVLKNNIFLFPIPTYWSIVNCDNSLFENNIFNCTSNLLIYLNNCVFNNNLFVENWNGQCNGWSCSTLNNIINQPQGSIFNNMTSSGFVYSDDYHLKATCPGKNAGKEGTDIGIYGGAFPWKDGSVPFNPHFEAATVAPTTTASGNLNIQITVSAQDH